jgi:hypothetical protein
MRRLVAGGVGLILAQACTLPGESGLGPAAVRVELDAFNGIPNPH